MVSEESFFVPDGSDGSDVSALFEVGMCYLVKDDLHKDWFMIFRHQGSAVDSWIGTDKVRNNNRCLTKMLLSGRTINPAITTPWVSGRMCRRATVDEETWYEECVRAGKFVDKGESLRNFEQRYTMADGR